MRRPRLRERVPRDGSLLPGDTFVPYLYIAPALVLFAVLVLLPFIASVWVSLFRWQGVGMPSDFVGLDNYLGQPRGYEALITDARLQRAFLHSLVLIFFYSVLPITIALGLASTMARSELRGMKAYRVIFFLPQVIPLVATGIVWRWMYNPDPAVGPINGLLAAVGSKEVTPFLGDFTLALPAIGVIGTWVLFGLCLVLFLAGIQKIPASLYDAAQVDGAGPMAKFLAVTLPGLRNEIVVALTLTMVLALRAFDVVAVTTKGGPGDETNVPSYEIYNRAFTYGFVGSAAAAATVLGLVILLVSYGIRRFGETADGTP
jgi:raffinose/stachyose/melibiose transport system permease protein